LKCNRKYSGRTAWLERAGQMKLIDGCMLGDPFAFQKECEDKQKMFSLPWGKRLTLFGGKVLLRFLAVFPGLILNSSMLVYRRDSQLKRLIPEEV
jgi:hypothetical protein